MTASCTVRPMRYRIRHTTKYAYSDPVAVCHNLVRLAPRKTPQQRVDSYRLVVTPEPSDLVQREDPFGNRVDYFSIQDAHRGLSLSAFSELEVAERPAEPPESQTTEQLLMALQQRGDPIIDAAYRFVFQSRHTPLLHRLKQYAETSFAPTRPVLDGVRELTTRIYNDFEYDPRATTVATPILEAFENRAGVCQDFAHVQVACLRSLGVPARYVSGYLRTLPPPGEERLVGADASHAWISVYCGPCGWIDFDPTNDCIPSSDHVTVAYGRDYADVCPIQGVFVGGGSHTLNVSVDVEPLD